MSRQSSKWVRLKTESTVFRQKQTHVELVSEAVRQFFFSQERNGFDKTSCAVQNTSWYLLHSIFSKQYIYLRIFFHLIVNDNWKQQTTALEDLLAIMCLMQTGIPWWNGVADFFINKKMASPKRSLLTKIQLHICRILYPPDDNPWA